MKVLGEDELGEVLAFCAVGVLCTLASTSPAFARRVGKMLLWKQLAVHEFSGPILSAFYLKRPLPESSWKALYLTLHTLRVCEWQVCPLAATLHKVKSDPFRYIALWGTGQGRLLRLGGRYLFSVCTLEVGRIELAPADCSLSIGHWSKLRTPRGGPCPRNSFSATCVPAIRPGLCRRRRAGGRTWACGADGDGDVQLSSTCLSGHQSAVAAAARTTASQRVVVFGGARDCKRTDGWGWDMHAHALCTRMCIRTRTPAHRLVPV